MEKMKIVHIGVGGFGKGWINVVKNSGEWEIAAIVDVGRENLEDAAKEYGLPPSKCFSTLTEFLEHGTDADALLNVTPPKFHAETAIGAMEAGLHVLIEKPLSDNMQDAQKMLESAAANNRKLMVSQNYRYKSQPRTIRKFIEDGSAGRISYVNVNFQKGAKFSGFRKEMDYPLLIDMSIHHFDLMRYLIGQDAARVYAESWNPGWSWFKGDACLNLLFEFGAGIRLSYTGSWVSTGRDTTWDGDWEIHGEKGTILWKDNTLAFLEQGQQKEINSLRLEREHQAFSLYEFYRSIKEEREPETGVKDNIKSLAMVFKALESIKKGIPVFF